MLGIVAMACVSPMPSMESIVWPYASMYAPGSANLVFSSSLTVERHRRIDASTHRQNWGPMVGECGVDGSVDGVLVIDAWTRASGKPWVINGANANSRKRTIPENR